MSGPKRGLALRENTPEELAGARACIERYVPEGADRDLILEAVFVEARPQRHAGMTMPADYVEARRDWLAHVRAWVFETTGRVISVVSDADEQAYITATGRRFVPPPVVEPKPRPPQPVRRMVPAGPARRRIEELLDAGMRQAALERAAGVPHSTIIDLRRRGADGEIREETARRILAVRYDAPAAVGSEAKR